VVILSTLYSFRRSSLERSAADPAIFDAQSSAKMVALIGVPMQPGWPIHGTMSISKGTGTANLQIPLAGPRGNGVLLEQAQQHQNKWRVCSLTFRSQDGIELALISPATSHCAPQE
jgi:hypothetical protein